jgi:putative IMPACT (imprinted ancient) family translation regulator
MKELFSGKLKVEKSLFYAHLYDIQSKDDIINILKSHKSMYKKSNHHCYAIRLSNTQNHIVETYKDDGEVGRPGKILLEIMKRNNLKNNALVVSRVFGGKKLGIAGVSKAFRNAGESVIIFYNKKNKIT